MEKGDENEESSTGSVRDDGEDQYTAESPQSGGPSHCVVTNPEAGDARTEVVGDQDEAHASQDPTDESPGPTADHTGDAADDRPESERDEIRINDDEGTQGLESTRDALPPSRSPVMMSRVLEVERDDDYATESSVGIRCVKPESADVYTNIPAKNVIARIRGKVKEDDLRDSNWKTGGQDDDEMLETQECIAEEKDEGRGGQRPLVDVLGVAPPGGVHTAPSGALSTSPASTHSQPASQDLRMLSKSHTVHTNDSVTLGVMAGAARVGGGGGRVGPRVSNRDECVHTKDGTCHIHGPGAKWRWRPIPPNQRTVGPDGKVRKRVYFWSCEVGSGGRNLRQAKLTFRRNADDEYRRDNGGTMGNNAMG